MFVSSLVRTAHVKPLVCTCTYPDPLTCSVFMGLRRLNSSLLKKKRKSKLLYLHIIAVVGISFLGWEYVNNLHSHVHKKMVLGMSNYIPLMILESCGFLSYMGHLKERTLKDQMAKDPTEVIRKAVLRMLPRNKLRAVSTSPVANLHPMHKFEPLLQPCSNL